MNVLIDVAKTELQISRSVFQYVYLVRAIKTKRPEIGETNLNATAYGAAWASSIPGRPPQSFLLTIELSLTGTPSRVRIQIATAMPYSEFQHKPKAKSVKVYRQQNILHPNIRLNRLLLCQT